MANTGSSQLRAALMATHLVLGCGGRTEDSLSAQVGDTGGVGPAAAGGSTFEATSASGGGPPVASGGTAGCVARSEVYAADAQFTWQPQGVIGLPDCVPTCSSDLQLISALPAGDCDFEPDCSMYAEVPVAHCPSEDAGTPCGYSVGYGFVCQCRNRRWSCVIAM
jgi:hypothetical protein